MVKIKPSITIDLGKERQRITLELDEAKELFNTLATFLNKGNNTGSNIDVASDNGRRKRRHHRASSTTSTIIKNEARGKGRSKTSLSSSMSEEKRKDILEHINKQLSDTKPRTLTNLLKGVSYTPNHIPYIRQIVESQGNIAKKRIGKRTYYLSNKQTSSKSASAATE